MKKIITLFLILIPFSGLALNGATQEQMEKIYDTYRAKYIEGQTTEEQSIKVKIIQKALSLYINNPKLGLPAKNTYNYLRHLFCEAESIINGLICQDNYNPAGPLTTDIKNMTLPNIRAALIGEHSKRRTNRGLSTLKESIKLNLIAQKYADSLCAAGYISHELNGSKLEQRYDDGDYNYALGGENLGSGQTTVGQILDQLTTSIHHRENMYEPGFSEIGVGQCKDIWVLNYGKPA